MLEIPLLLKDSERFAAAAEREKCLKNGVLKRIEKYFDPNLALLLKFHIDISVPIAYNRCVKLCTNYERDRESVRSSCR
jgi:hypothetical protein